MFEYSCHKIPRGGVRGFLCRASGEEHAERNAEARAKKNPRCPGGGLGMGSGYGGGGGGKVGLGPLLKVISMACLLVESDGKERMKL